MFTIASTRFNNSTLAENLEYRIKTNNACIYCSPQRMSPKIKTDSLVFIVEMNNELNQIEGIGLIKNTIKLDKYFKVYEDCNFNRYVFKGNYRINREELIRYNSKLVEVLDNILFKGKTHLKRGSGITTITDKLLKNERCERLDIKSIIKEIFINNFNTENIENIEENENK
jgi:hypothetical protein